MLEQSHEHLRHAESAGSAARRSIPRWAGPRSIARLEVLTHLGIVRPIYLGDQSVCFCRADGAHHHLICSDCGVVTEFDECIIDELQQTLSEQLNFQIKGHLLEFYGLCERCHE